jgi:hypothetical protein
MRKLPRRAFFFAACGAGRYFKSLFDCVPKFSAVGRKVFSLISSQQ